MLYRLSRSFSVVVFLLCVSTWSLFQPAWGEILIPDGPLNGALQSIQVNHALWERYTGEGIVVGVVDESMYMRHPGYVDRVITGDCVSLTKTVDGNRYVTVAQTAGSGPSDEDAELEEYDHGAMMAGIVAAYFPEDGISSVYGVALGSSLVGIQNDLSVVITPRAITYEGTNHIDVKNNSYGVSEGYMDTSCALGTLESTISTTYGGNIADYNTLTAFNQALANNTILVFAAGNEREDEVGDFSIPNCRDSNKKALQAAPQTITVAALGEYDKFGNYDTYASYSCFGSCVFVSAPGTMIDATDPPEYSSQASGTSMATPFVTGALALAAQAVKSNPNVAVLETRLAKHLLATTSTKLDTGATAEEVKWTTNAAGYSFSPTYGFGRLNVTALVNAAETTLGVTNASRLTTYIDGYALEGGKYSDREELAYLSSESWINDPVEEEEGFGKANVLSASSSTVSGDSLALATAVAPGTASILAEGGTLVAQYTETYTEDTFNNAGVNLQKMEDYALTVGASGTLSDMRIEVTHTGLEGSGLDPTNSVLTFQNSEHLDTETEVDWTFVSNAFWGEDPLGTWDIKVYDMYGAKSIDVQSMAQSFYMGEVKTEQDPVDPTDPTDPSIPVPEPSTWTLLVLGGLFLGLRCRRRGTKQG